LEDVVEEIIGEFYDEHHPADRDMIPVGEHEILMRARVRLDEINERFKLKIQPGEADTIGGYILQELGTIPRVGDVLEVPGATIKVEEMAHRRIKTVRLRIHPQTPEPE